MELHAFPWYYMRMNVSGKIHPPFVLPLGKHPFCPSTCKLGRSRCRSGRVKEEKNFLSLQRIEPRFLGRPVFSLVTNRPKISQLMLHVVVNIKFRLSHMESNFCRPVHSPPIHCLYLKHVLISTTLKFHIRINIPVTFIINLGHLTVSLMLKQCVMKLYITFTFLNLGIRRR
jgi:hypothetical protein